jgi:hypothetical protein
MKNKNISVYSTLYLQVQEHLAPVTNVDHTIARQGFSIVMYFYRIQG